MEGDRFHFSTQHFSTLHLRVQLSSGARHRFARNAHAQSRCEALTQIDSSRVPLCLRERPLHFLTENDRDSVRAHRACKVGGEEYLSGCCVMCGLAGAAPSRSFFSSPMSLRD